MPRGGARPGCGRKRGGRNDPSFELIGEENAERARKMTRADRHQLLKRKVALCVADGMLPAKIAAVMCIKLERLEALYAHELEHGREIIRAEQLLCADLQSAAGKTAGTKLLLESSNRAGGTPSPKDHAKAEQESIVAGALKLISGGKK